MELSDTSHRTTSSPPLGVVDYVLRWAALLGCLSLLAASLVALQSVPRPVLNLGDNFGLFPLASHGRQTLVVWLNSSCRACIETMPILRDATQEPRSFHVVVAGIEPAEVLSQFAGAHGLVADEFISVPTTAPRPEAFPTIFVVDQGGRVANYSVGYRAIVNGAGTIFGDLLKPNTRKQ